MLKHCRWREFLTEKTGIRLMLTITNRRATVNQNVKLSVDGYIFGPAIITAGAS